MSKSGLLRTSEVRAMFNLVGECRDLGDDPQAWRLHWLGRMALLIDAALLFGGDVVREFDGALRPMAHASFGWDNGFSQEVLLAGMAEDGGDLRFSPLMSAYFARPMPFDGRCFTRRDLVRDHRWRRSSYYHRLHRPLGIEHTLLCFAPVANFANVFSTITASRELSDRRNFSLRDKTLVREISDALGRLVGGPLARMDEPTPAALSPRARQVLTCLLEGDSDKQAAKRLNISPYTVNQYTKLIYHHFKVQGRSELMARWIRRTRMTPIAGDKTPRHLG